MAKRRAGIRPCGTREAPDAPEHRLWRSPNLGWEMGVAVFGHFGPPLLFFPTSLGDEWEHEARA